MAFKKDQHFACGHPRTEENKKIAYSYTTGNPYDSCKKCSAERSLKYYYNNREKIIKSKKERRRKNFANRIEVNGKLVSTNIPADKHGTIYAVRNYGCQCTPCEKVSIEHNQEYYKTKESRKKEYFAKRTLINGRLVADWLPEEKHGKATTYTNYGCRCQPCRKAISSYNKRYKKNKQ